MPVFTRDWTISFDKKPFLMIHSINIFVHILTGTIAIIIALLAYSSTKGGKRHARYGRIFLWLMAIVILTALNGVLFFRDRPFLTVVTFLAFYTSYSGYRVLKIKEIGFQLIDFLVMLLVFGIGISFVVRMESANIVWNAKVVYYLLGYVLLIVAFDMSRYFFPNWIPLSKYWLYDHIYKMTGSFSALISAGAGTVFANYEPWNQIMPAIFGTVWLVFCLVYFPKTVRNQSATNPKETTIFR